MSAISNTKEALAAAKTRMEKAVEDFRKELSTFAPAGQMHRCWTASASIITARLWP